MNYCPKSKEISKNFRKTKNEMLMNCTGMFLSHEPISINPKTSHFMFTFKSY